MALADHLERKDTLMECWMLWHGGSSYAHGYIPEDLEHFKSLTEAVSAFDRRADSWETFYPCVERTEPEEGGPSAWIFLAEPDGDPYPDRIIEFGPRGGIHVERA
jgi:hypothetical protein